MPSWRFRGLDFSFTAKQLLDHTPIIDLLRHDAFSPLVLVTRIALILVPSAADVLKFHWKWLFAFWLRGILHSTVGQVFGLHYHCVSGVYVHVYVVKDILSLQGCKLGQGQLVWMLVGDRRQAREHKADWPLQVEMNLLWRSAGDCILERKLHKPPEQPYVLRV